MKKVIPSGLKGSSSKVVITKSLSNRTEERSKPKNDFSYKKWWDNERVQEG